MNDSSDLQPNIVVVMTDDMGACDLSFYGNRDASTPHIDQLARDSLRLESFYVTPLCAPTRASFLTGRDYLRTGVSNVHGGKDHLSLRERTVAELLQAAGYTTATWGKWHSGVSDGYLPHQRGFDETLLLRLYRHRDPIGRANGGEELHFDGRWGDEVIVDYALDFAQRNRDRPFFALLASMTPHGPLDAPQENVELLMKEKGLSRRLATLHAQMSVLDRAVGRLREGIDNLDTGGRETIVLFFSDNGPAMLEDKMTDEERARRNNLPLRGWKGDVWENGIRSPLYLYAPGRFTPGVVHRVADVTDLLPTFIEWAGASYPEDQKPLDGRSLSPVLNGDTMDERTIHRWVHFSVPPAPGRGEEREKEDELRPVCPEEKHEMKPGEQVMSIRDGAWKYLRNADRNRPGGPHPQDFLANVEEDPGETTNHASKEAAQLQLQTLGGKLDAWWQEMLAEPDSFGAPESLIRSTGSSCIRATACAWLSASLRNDVSAVRGFCMKKQAVRWRIHAESCRTLWPSFEWAKDQQPPPGSTMKLSCSGAEIFGQVQSDGNCTWDCPLSVDAGPNTLELEILSMPKPPEPLNLLRVYLGESLQG